MPLRNAGASLKKTRSRTEAQQRGALHSHILCWHEKRNLKKFDNYSALPGIPREAPGTDCRQRPKSQVVPDLAEYQDDNIYFHNMVARIWGECVRPHLRDDENKEPWGGFDYVSLRFAGLTRSIQSRTHLHQCSLRYCLHSQSSCRFFSHGPKCHTKVTVTTLRESLYKGAYRPTIGG